MKLTIAMATYDDYNGVFFTVNALRLYHPICMTDEVEFVVIDSNPDSPHGREVASLCRTIKATYIQTTVSGAWVKYQAFDFAQGDVVLVIDCHVLLHAGGIDAVLDYFKDGNHDMLQGPCVYDCLKAYGTHFDPVWRDHDFGMWGTNKEAYEKGDPFEIPMVGMGCFALRRDAWKGINQGFRGFGSEEWYMAEKVRSWGGKVMCHPSLKWTHRWGRPDGVPYKFSLEDKIYNYAVGWNELYGFKDPRFIGMVDHFCTQMNPETVCSIVEQAITESTKSTDSL